MAKNVFGKKIVAAIYLVIGLVLLMGAAHAINKTQADWYLHVDIQAIKQSSLKDLIEYKSDDNDVDKLLTLALGEQLKQETEQITIYGAHTGFNDFTLMMQGDFSEQARKSFHQKLVQEKNYDIETLAGKTIYSWLFTGYHSVDDKIDIDVDDDEPVKLYATELEPKLIIVSRDKNEIKSWIKGQYSISELEHEGVFEVVVNMQNALAHGGINFGKEKIDMGFDSSVMQKVLQFSFSVAQNKNTTDIEVGLVTSDSAVAMQLKNIVSGLIALQALAGDEDEDVQALTQNLTIEAQDENVILKSSIDTAEIQKLAK